MAKLNTTQKSIVRAAAIVGGQHELARRAKVTQAAISLALKTGRVGHRVALGIEYATDALVKRAEVAPEIYPPVTYWSEHGKKGGTENTINHSARERAGEGRRSQQ